MTRQRSFKTAAARRRANPIVWEVDDHPPITLRASVNLVELADVLGSIAEMKPDKAALDPAKVGEMLQAIRDGLRQFVTPESHETWDRVAPDLDIDVLNEMIAEVLSEFTGMDPTQRPSSSDGSSTDGGTSTAGAVPAPTPQLSPPTVE